MPCTEAYKEHIEYKARKGNLAGNGQDSEWVERWKNA